MGGCCAQERQDEPAPPLTAAEIASDGSVGPHPAEAVKLLKKHSVDKGSDQVLEEAVSQPEEDEHGPTLPQSEADAAAGRKDGPRSSLRLSDAAMVATSSPGSSPKSPQTRVEGASRQEHRQSLAPDAAAGGPVAKDVVTLPTDTASAIAEEITPAKDLNYHRELAVKLHNMVVSQLSEAQAAIFTLFAAFDENLDGVLSGDEKRKMYDLISEVFKHDPAVDDVELAESEDGSLSFTSLMSYFGHSTEFGDPMEALNKSGKLKGLRKNGDLIASRLKFMPVKTLQNNVVGYKRLLFAVVDYEGAIMLSDVAHTESESGLKAAIEDYYNLLVDEFEGYADHLFELFCEIDTSGNMKLEKDEAVQLLRLLDKSATDTDLAAYLEEINREGKPIGFVHLWAWWDQALKVPSSLVSQKGASLLDNVDAEVAARANTKGETPVGAHVRRAIEERRLQQVKEACIQTYREVRRFKCARDIVVAENDALKAAVEIKPGSDDDL